MTPLVHIICFGNLWHGDDGFGIHVFRRLSQLPLPSHVKVFDAGTSGLSAIDYFENCQKVVIVDAIRSGELVGNVRRVSWPVQGYSDEFSLHALGVTHLLMTLPVVFEGRVMPEVLMIGAEIDDIVPFTDQLSFPLKGAVERAIDLIRNEW